MILILALIIGGAALIFGAQTMMPFAVVNRLIEEFNTNGISSVLRSDNLLDLQLSMSDQNIGLTETQISSLEENGFYVGTYAGTKTLTYKKRNGKYQTVVSTSVNAGVQPANDIMSRLPEGTAASFMNPAVIDVTEAFKDSEFKNAYTTASKTWRGGNSGWFDQLAELAETAHGYSRSRWFNYAARSLNAGANSLFKSVAKSTISTGSGSAEAVGVETETTTTTVDADGNTHTETEIDVDTVKTRSGLDIAQKFTSMASTGVNVACAAVEGFMGVQTLITTYQRLQKLNLVSGYMEAVQKIQAGDGKDSPMDEYNNRLTAVDEETGKTAMSSAGMSALFSGTKISNSDESVRSINAEYAMTEISESQDSAIMSLFADIVGSGNGLLKAFTVCNYARGTLAVANAAFTVASVIPIIGQGLKLFQLGFKAIAKAVVTTLITAAAPIIAQKVVEAVGKSLIEDVATEWLGRPLGDAMTSGGNSLLSANHQTGGGSPASKTKLGYFKQLQDDVIAAEAEYQRQTRSPFDISSQYTFLGSIVYSLVPMANSSELGSIIKSMGNVVKSSVTDLLPTASAIAETELIGIADPGDCPTLESIGIQGDPYCNPLYITDTGTINVAYYDNIYYDASHEVAANGYYGNVASYSPEEIVQTELAWGNITETSEGVYTIKADSNLAKYATYCGQRVSSWGIADANIASALSTNSSGILSMIPLLGDALEVAAAATNITNLPWTTGSICVASEENEYWCEMSVHQRFIEDERWRENIGAISSNPVAAYFEDYYEQNPLDNSYEGILARYSGMTKDDVIATLDFIDAMDYIANYKPETRLAFGRNNDKSTVFFESTENSDLTIALEPKFFAYFDLRNRVATV